MVFAACAGGAASWRRVCFDIGVPFEGVEISLSFDIGIAGGWIGLELVGGGGEVKWLDFVWVGGVDLFWFGVNDAGVWVAQWG